MDRRVCQATVHGVRKELDMTEYGCIFKSYYKYAPGYIENMHKQKKKMISEFKVPATQTETTEGKKKSNDLWDSVNQKGRAIRMFENVMAEIFANLKKK